MAAKLIAEGAEASVYRTTIFGIDAILKDRRPKAYRIRQLDESIRLSRTKSEAKITAMADSIGVRVPNILFVKRYSLYTSYIDGVQMSAMLQLNRHVSAEAMEKAGEYLGVLHGKGIVHGDFTPANILLGKSGGPWIIDFGLASISNSIEDKALDVLLMKRSIDAGSYSAFLKGYSTRSKECDAVLHRLAEIEKRGRYNERV